MEIGLAVVIGALLIAVAIGGKRWEDAVVAVIARLAAFSIWVGLAWCWAKYAVPSIGAVFYRNEKFSKLIASSDVAFFSYLFAMVLLPPIVAGLLYLNRNKIRW